MSVGESLYSNLIGDNKTVVVGRIRSFFAFPNIACIPRWMADHLDIYDDQSMHLLEFGQRKIRVNFNQRPSVDWCYGAVLKCCFSAFNVRIENGSYLFDIKTKESLSICVLDYLENII
jgi:UDP-N-acetylmuramate--alanine ligase